MIGTQEHNRLYSDDSSDIKIPRYQDTKIPRYRYRTVCPSLASTIPRYHRFSAEYTPREVWYVE